MRISFLLLHFNILSFWEWQENYLFCLTLSKALEVQTAQMRTEGLGGKGWLQVEMSFIAQKMEVMRNEVE